MNAVKNLGEQIEKKQVELEQAQRQGNWEAAARIQYGEQRDLKTKLEEAEKRVRQMTKEGNALVKEEVTAEEIAEVVTAEVWLLLHDATVGPRGLSRSRVDLRAARLPVAPD